MGELIRREAALKPILFSGERLTSATSGQVEIEHYHRYLLAREFCRGKDILDVAAGEGYGTALLAQVAVSAVGIEIDQDAVDAARAEFVRPNLRYEQGDARKLNIPDASIDVAVSFETLEHLAEQDTFLSELRRVLRDDGLLIISTPDRDIYSPNGTAPNPYHVLELTKIEFEALVQKYFLNCTLTSQRSLIGSVIIGGEQATAVQAFERRSSDVIERSTHLLRAPYLLAFASNGELPPVPNSVYVHRSDLDTDPRVRFEAEVANREKSAALETAKLDVARMSTLLQTTDLDVARMSTLLETAELDIARMSTLLETAKLDVARLLTENDQVSTRIARADHRISSIELSTIWRLTQPLRNFGMRFPQSALYMRKSIRLAWWVLSFQIFRRYKMWLRHRETQQSLVQSGPPIPLFEKEISLSELGESGPPIPPFDREISASEIVVPHSDKPEVSIIISTYGSVGVTLACLRSIMLYAPSCSIEVIVIDDAYPDSREFATLQQVRGVICIRNEKNLGFLLSCNSAAKIARGQYIYLLNNDTELEGNSVDVLVDLLKSRPDAGMAGSKLLFSDGRLQEAGGIIWNDASGWNYGRGDDAAKPEYNYVREVDYCSGASIMIARELFSSLGGFDESFVPAYYEDVDLAFRVRERGMAVLFQPRSVVIHHEGVSHGTDTSSGVKAHQVTNQSRFFEKWKSILVVENFRNAQNVLRARDRAKFRSVILVIDHYVPEPDRDAGSRSMLGIIESLLAAGWVVKFWPHNRLYSATYTVALEALGIEVIDHRWSGDLSTWMDLNGAELDHVLVARPDIAGDVLPSIISRTDAVLSYYGVDLHFARMRLQAELQNDVKLGDESERMQRLERRVWRHFDLVIYPSNDEAIMVQSLSPRTNATGIVPFFTDVRESRCVPPMGYSILFVAGFAHPPNVDAALFLLMKIIPLLELELGVIRVTLAGSNPTESVQALRRPNVTVTGYISEEALAELYEQHRVCVVPLRFGAGVKGKVIEALGKGLPLVTTSVGAQGIPSLESVVMVHDGLKEIVASLKVLLTDDAAWVAQSQAQLAFARQNYSREAMQKSVLAALKLGETSIGRGAVN
ncbi:methyltransferase domain-containing protein [Tardiphaga sp. vice304]|uniref:methyltransferase domain-containing protein n=1 Tax=Tardiphaga sp. vice304 TaxID=2592817 RepID=UPI0011633A61|nr:methyltransferase domain-containing protein [Tardiphaga sp. vice304]QDM28179.1 methyltransferase domain-containing protein [Tardiphaga sp. vice304]